MAGRVLVILLLAGSEIPALNGMLVDRVAPDDRLVDSGSRGRSRDGVLELMLLFRGVDGWTDRQTDGQVGC